MFSVTTDQILTWGGSFDSPCNEHGFSVYEGKNMLLGHLAGSKMFTAPGFTLYLMCCFLAEFANLGEKRPICTVHIFLFQISFLFGFLIYPFGEYRAKTGSWTSSFIIQNQYQVLLRS